MDYALILRLDLTSLAPEGPGWYIYATSADGNAPTQCLVKPQRLSGHEAHKIAYQMQQARSKDQDGQMTLVDIVKSGNERILQSIQEQITYAEHQAKRIAQLRRTLQIESEESDK